jgi:hypothetical protein
MSLAQWPASQARCGMLRAHMCALSLGKDFNAAIHIWLA